MDSFPWNAAERTAMTTTHPSTPPIETAMAAPLATAIVMPPMTTSTSMMGMATATAPVLEIVTMTILAMMVMLVVVMASTMVMGKMRMEMRMQMTMMLILTRITMITMMKRMSLIYWDLLKVSLISENSVRG